MSTRTNIWFDWNTNFDIPARMIFEPATIASDLPFPDYKGWTNRKFEARNAVNASIIHRRENSASHLKPPLNLAKCALTRALFSTISTFIRVNQRNKYFTSNVVALTPIQLSKKKPWIFYRLRFIAYKSAYESFFPWIK